MIVVLLSVILLSVVLLNVTLLGVILMSANLLIVVAPLNLPSPDPLCFTDCQWKALACSLDQ